MNNVTGGGIIPAGLFKILKDDAIKVPHSICQHISKSQQWPQVSNLRKSVFIPIPKKDSAKEYSNNYTVVLILHTSKVMLQILQARLQ